MQACPLAVQLPHRLARYRSFVLRVSWSVQRHDLYRSSILCLLRAAASLLAVCDSKESGRMTDALQIAQRCLCVREKYLMVPTTHTQ